MGSSMRQITSFLLAGLWVFALPIHARLPINTELIKKSVVFIYSAQNRRDPGSNRVLGTGFIVGLPLKSDPTKVNFAVVTARHVLDPEWDGCNRTNPDAVYLRVNKRNYDADGDQSGVEYLLLRLTIDGRKTWFAHTDERVDVAVIAVNAKKLSEYDTSFIRLRDFGTEEEIQKHGIGVGDGTVSAGVVQALANVNRNYPAFKFGKISSVLEEPVQTRCCPSSECPVKLRLLWFVDANFIPGNSGSPVFLLPIEISLGAGLEYTGPRPMLLGVLASIIAPADLGGMVPVEYIFEVIENNLTDVDLYRGRKKDKSEPESGK